MGSGGEGWLGVGNFSNYSVNGSGASGSDSPQCSFCTEACLDPIVNYLLCAKEDQNDLNCLSSATLILVLEWGIALSVFLAFSIILLQIVVCGLGCKIHRMRK